MKMFHDSAIATIPKADLSLNLSHMKMSKLLEAFGVTYHPLTFVMWVLRVLLFIFLLFFLR